MNNQQTNKRSRGRKHIQLLILPWCPMYHIKCLFSSSLNVLQEKPQLFNNEEFLPLDPTQELIFPPELIVCHEIFFQATTS